MVFLPISATRLGIGFKEYYEIARNILRMKLIPLDQRKEILNRAEKTLPGKLSQDADDLMMAMASEPAVYQLAELEYSKGPPINQKLFSTAIVDYLLNHPELYGGNAQPA